MKLYVMRHGPAEDTAPSGLDSDRALSQEGRERTRAVARALVDEGEVPLTICASPLVRAVQTAEIVASVIGDKTATMPRSVAVEIRREMAPSGGALALVLELARSGHDRAMVVGHEPDVSTLVSRLVNVYPEQGMRTAMVAGIEVDASPRGAESQSHARAFTAKLLFVLDPTTLTFHR